MSNRIQEAFDTVKAEQSLKDSTREYLKQQRQKQDSQLQKEIWQKHRGYRNALVAVCMLLLMIGGAGGYSLFRMPVSYISIDVNPSIELTLNRLDRVISAKAYNEDGEIVLNGVSVRGKKYTEAVDYIVESDAMQPYLTQNSALTFTVASGDGEKETSIVEGINRCEGCGKHGGKSTSVSTEEIAQAHENGLSFGKYAAYLELAQYDDAITPADCQDMTMREIHDLIEEHEDDEKHGGDGVHESEESHDSDGDYESEESHDSDGTYESEESHDSDGTYEGAESYDGNGDHERENGSDDDGNHNGNGNHGNHNAQFEGEHGNSNGNNNGNH